MKSGSLHDPELDGSAKVKARPRRRWLVDALVILFFVCPLNLLLLSPILTSPNLGKPRGQGVPTERPDESNRVLHPLGFSIIVPPHWEVTLREGPELFASPRELLPGRYIAGITLARYGKMKPSQEDESDFHAVRFQGQPAFERTKVVLTRRSRRILAHNLIFQRGGEWYSLEYQLPGNRESLPQIMQTYFNTFRDPSATEDKRQGLDVLHNGPRTTDNGPRQ